MSLFQRRAAEPFRFVDYEGLIMPTGLKAANLREFRDLIATVPHDVVANHLHRAPLRHRFGVWDWPNDFAQWAAEGLEDRVLAEKLAALDPYALGQPDEARERILELVEEHLDSSPWVPWARRGFEFHFTSGHYLALPGDREAATLHEFRTALSEVPLSSIFYHFHEARWRGPDRDVDDFSLWIAAQFGADAIVRRFRAVDFYFFSLTDLQQRLSRILDEAPVEEPG